MTAWSGGPCPSCGEEMPPNLVHCQVCRELLNPSLETDSVEVPQFRPLQEIAAMVDTEPRGYYLACPSCDRELRINRKYAGVRVQCKFCQTPFVFSTTDPELDLLAAFCDCPHCSKELRASTKYLGTKVACKHCNGHIRLVENAPQDSP